MLVAIKICETVLYMIRKNKRKSLFARKNIFNSL